MVLQGVESRNGIVNKLCLRWPDAREPQRPGKHCKSWEYEETKQCHVAEGLLWQADAEWYP